jgi:hypothetical protein
MYRARSLGVVVLACLPVRAAAQDVFADLPVGHWAVVSQNTIAHVDPCPGGGCSYSGNTGQRSVIAAWNGTPPRRRSSAAGTTEPGSPEEAVLAGRRFFTTGLGRWSLDGAAWGSCVACHIDGLSDNVTWYFGRGPRQSTSLDGSFSNRVPRISIAPSVRISARR